MIPHIKDKVKRLAEINSDYDKAIQEDHKSPLINPFVVERINIINYLKMMNVIDLDPIKGGFYFIGNNSLEYTNFYLQIFENN